MFHLIQLLSILGKKWKAICEIIPKFSIFTARKRNLRRLCFYTCLSFFSQGGGLQANTQRGGWGVWVGWGRSPGPHWGWGCVQAHTRGMEGIPSPGGCIPACTEADTPYPPQQTATGMHSRFGWLVHNQNWCNFISGFFVGCQSLVLIRALKFITVDKGSYEKVMFFMCLSVHSGVVPDPSQEPDPRTRHTPPSKNMGPDRK